MNPGQPVISHCLAGGQTERSDPQARKIGQHQFSCSGARKHGLGFCEKKASCRSQSDLATDTIKEQDGISAFKRSDRGTRRRLGQIQFPGGARDMLVFGNRHKDAQLFKSH